MKCNAYVLAALAFPLASVALAGAVSNAPPPLRYSFRAGEKERLLRDLTVRDDWTVRRAADRLARVPADKDPEVVAKALSPLLSHSNSWVRTAAARALVNWATGNSTQPLITALDDKDFWVRQAVMEALGRLRTPEAAKAVVARLSQRQDRGNAVATLKTMGAAAEPALLPCLRDGDGWLQLEACRILEEVGTRKSIPALEEYGLSGKPFSKEAAGKAIKAIQARP